MTKLELIQKQLKELKIYREYLLSVRILIEQTDKVKTKTIKDF